MKSEILRTVKTNHPEIYRELIGFHKTQYYAEKWLQSPHWMLYQKTPIEALEESPQSVMDLLNTLQRVDFS